MTLDEWLTVAVLAAMIFVLVTDRAPAAFAVFGSVVALLVLGVIDTDQAFSGFAATAPIAIAGLYVVAGAVEKTGALLPVVDLVLGPTAGRRRRLARLTVPIGAASAFIANTPVVALVVPPVGAWADRRGEARSKLLIPLSYASILGGVITVIGTSTNLLVSSLLADATGEPLGMFELTPVGLPVAVVGLATVALLGPTLLPDRRAPAPTDAEARDFTVAMRVVPDGPIDGRTVTDAGLRHLQGVYLVELQRADRTISAVGPTQTLRGGDLLTFVGRAEDAIDLQRLRGLESAELEHALATDGGDHIFFECVVGTDSPLNGTSIRDAGFRGRYQSAVLAVHRSGERLGGRLGDIVLRGGDTLLVLAGPDFRDRMRDRRDFLLVARLGGRSLTATRHAPLSLAVLAAVVALPVLGVLDLVQSALLAAVGLVIARILTVAEARAAVQLDVIVTIGASFGLGAAVSASGLSSRIADGLLDTFGGYGVWGATLAVVLTTMVLTELVTNAAAAVVAVPVALDIAARTDLDPRVLVIAVAVAASCSFLTPIGYQTNTMVYGPGGYRYTDYLRLGLPLTAVTVVTITAAVVSLG